MGGLRLIRRVPRPPATYDADSQRRRIISSHRVKRCGTCTYEVPEADIVVEDGAEHCPLCRDIITAQWLAGEESYVANVKDESYTRLVTPPQLSIRALHESRPAAITSVTDANGNLLSQSAPLRLVRNVATTVLVNGQYFSSAMSFVYPTGITDSTPPVINSTKAATLTLIAASGMATGSYSLTINDGVSKYGNVYTNIFSVR